MSKPKVDSKEDRHLFYVYCDPEFADCINKLGSPPESDTATEDGWKAPYNDVAEEFAISFDDVYKAKRFGEMGLLASAYRIGDWTVSYNEENEKIEIAVTPDITQAEFYELWNRIAYVKRDKLGISRTKRKPPEQDRLIYAIFRAHKHGLTYEEIFQQYKEKTLAHYEGEPNRRFDTGDELRLYFLKHRPTRYKSTV